jgi:hypothetical protein
MDGRKIDGRQYIYIYQSSIYLYLFDFICMRMHIYIYVCYMHIYQESDWWSPPPQPCQVQRRRSRRAEVAMKGEATMAIPWWAGHQVTA